jgi:hypothetical protein
MPLTGNCNLQGAMYIARCLIFDDELVYVLVHSYNVQHFLRCVYKLS